MISELVFSSSVYRLDTKEYERICASIYTNTRIEFDQKKNLRNVTYFNYSDSTSDCFQPFFTHTAPFGLSPGLKTFKSTISDEFTLHVSYAFSSDQKYIFTTLVDETGQLHMKKVLENKFMTNKGKLSLALNLLNLIYMICEFVKVFDKNCHLVICKVGYYSKGEILLLTPVLTVNSLNKLLTNSMSNKDGQQVAESKVQFVSSTLLSIDVNRFLQIEDTAFIKMANQSLYYSEFNQSLGISLKLYANLIVFIY